MIIKKSKFVMFLSILFIPSGLAGVGTSIGFFIKNNINIKNNITVITEDLINNLKAAILNTITDDRLTRSEFNADMFEIVSNNFVSGDENLGKLVNEVYFSEQNPNGIVIKLNSSVKYSLPGGFNDKSVVLKENTLYITFDALNFYQAISLSSDSLVQLRNDVLNSVSTIGAGNFNETELQNSTTIINTINNLKTSDNTNLGNYINTPTYSQETNSINITINDKVGLYVFNPVSLEGIQISKNTISLITESPESWFTWSGNQITGLSNIGLQQENIVLPARAETIDINAFNNFNNPNNLVSVDMSLTSIKVLEGIYQTPIYKSEGVFMGCDKLKKIILPNTLESIGDATFVGTAITTIDLPNTITSIGYQAFASCKYLTSISIPPLVDWVPSLFWLCDSLSLIDIQSPNFRASQWVFSDLKDATIRVLNTDVKQSIINSGFKGTVEIINNK